MEKQGELKVPVTEGELERIRKAAEATGVDVEEWARDVLLKLLHERDERT